ncbi:hypothetical protein ACO2Q0_15210 [Phenylobacterium sp. VNQ135]|uniref:hypothetical protein n=1 Tax=Phenylobacterium sp. VNQ135 TaxID=3400922 RepID=UPI003C0F429E
MTADPDRELRVRLAAHEILLRRLIGELEVELPGTIDRLAGPYETAVRPDEAFQAFVAEVDDHVSLILSKIRADLRDG